MPIDHSRLPGPYMCAMWLGTGADDTGGEESRNSASIIVPPQAEPHDECSIVPLALAGSIGHDRKLQQNPDKASHPGQNLAEDVLSDIFSWCTVTVGTNQTVALPFLHPIPFAITLTHVCAFWRRVAFNTPDLWNDFRLDYRKVNRPHVQEWLARARRFRISVCLMYGMDDYQFNNFVSSFLSIYRIKLLKLLVTCKQLPVLLSKGRNETLEHLVLTMGHKNDPDHHSKPILHPCFPFPNLRTFSFVPELHCVDWDIQWLQDLPWDHLRRLLLLGPQITPLKLKHYMKRVVALESFMVLEMGPDVNYCHPSDAIILPHLKQLRMTMYRREGIPCQLLSLLRHPNLESLSIDGNDMKWDSRVFSYLARQSNFNKLRTLKIYGTVSDDLDVTRLLESVPNVRELCLPAVDQDTLTKLENSELGSYIFDFRIRGASHGLPMTERRQRAQDEWIKKL
ncbi:hypothetical protein AMATHDRAFT_42104 [Amanita thiersii Skay4041]|uniref:F-box domain-containing protein n=1 Tax=Amanita thiersii Skay4041 TaxID=703135 RepID=A0A2A9NLQ3_9AGAR|nr:hypothetical protein AMATHDRAFT_42104 [Amanita thiersii Skay4041]